MKMVRFVSDYTPEETPNVLKIIQNDDGDVILDIYEHKDNINTSGVRFALSGSRLRKNHAEIIQTLHKLVQLLEENGDDE